jgi:AraC-like DNA-binding protein
MPGISIAWFRDRGRTGAGRRAITHPAVTIVLEFGPGRLIVHDAAGRQHRGSLVAGLAFGAVRVGGEDFQALQMRLSPLVARGVLGVPPGDLSGAVVALDDLWGSPVDRLREQLGAASTWQDRFDLAEALLRRRWRTAVPMEPEVAMVWNRILQARGQVCVGPLADEVGWSRKRLWSRFGAQIGLSPKHAARLVRFDHAVHRLAAGEHTARVAAEAGYADQSHLHRDVREFTTLTPTTVANEPWLAVDDLAWPHRSPPG